MMMKRSLILTWMVLVAATIVTIQISCNKSDAQIPPNITAAGHMIPMDTANRMISSYLKGINYTVNTKETRSFTTDAQSLIDYLSDSRIKKVKIFLAHNLAYINSGHEGQRPQPNDNAYTLVIAGMDSTDHYILDVAHKVYDQLNPCPDQCAGSSLITAE